MQTTNLGGPSGKAEVQRRARHSKQTHYGISTLGVLAGVVCLVLVLIWALNLESQLPSLRIAEQPPAGTTQKILEPGAYKADDLAIARTGNWFSQTLGTSGTASTSASVVTSTSGSEMAFTFYGTELSMNARIGPESGEVRVTIDGESSPTLPSDNSGSFVDLSGNQAEETSILLADGLAYRNHTVVIRSSSNADVAISRFDVTSSTPFPWAFTIFYTGLATLLFVLVRLSVLMISRERGWLR